MALDKAIDSAQLDENLTAVADAIRAKGGMSGALTFPNGFVDAVAAIQAGGGDDDLEAFIAGTYAKDLTVAGTAVRANVFNGLNLANHTIYAPELVVATSSAFSNLTVGAIAAPKLTTANGSAFQNLKIPSIDFPSLTTAKDGNNFRNCTAKTVNLPLLTTNTNGRVFNYMYNLEEISLPSTTSLGQYMFEYCTALKKVDLGTACSVLINSAFTQCKVLDTVILRSNSVVTLENVNVFGNTPFASGGTGGTVYVPQALIEEYQTATNWVTLYGAGTVTFAAIEGSEYE